jgi:hypothetical protein
MTADNKKLSSYEPFAGWIVLDPADHSCRATTCVGACLHSTSNDVGLNRHGEDKVAAYVVVRYRAGKLPQVAYVEGRMTESANLSRPGRLSEFDDSLCAVVHRTRTKRPKLVD